MTNETRRVVRVGTGPKVLCLHGFRTNADIFRMQLGSMISRFKDHFEFVIPDAPFPAMGPSDDMVNKFYPQEALRDWYFCPGAAETSREDLVHLPFLTSWNMRDDCVGLRQSLRYISDDVAPLYGPFVG